jgi:hypothetical protein
VLDVVVRRVAAVIPRIVSAIEKRQIGKSLAQVARVGSLIQVLEDAEDFGRDRVGIGSIDAILNVEFVASVHRTLVVRRC